MQKEQTHPHKLKRVNTAKKGQPAFYVYKCVKCRFFLQEKLCTGLDAECWRCTAMFLMEQHNLRQSRPRCRECTGKSIPLTEMPPPRVDLGSRVKALREEPPPSSEAITSEMADKLVDKFLNLNILGKVKR